ncbi:YccS family putative transporter [Psychrobacter sp. I-STPA6b]|uniref:YccS family putative transporter n=1 Tax=Psychrobacter sp. I-STPA6b TaxID=2585718 RepID=UPI001D0C1349|nr:YccS family putative transporter [Psychrobacter sp. I-STPA6b]
MAHQFSSFLTVFNTFNSRYLSNLPLFVSMVLASLGVWYFHAIDESMALFLGIIAGGLVDLDNRFTGRLRNTFATLLLFALASLAIQLSINHSGVLVILLTASAFIITMAGALDMRYRTIAFGTLLVMIYTLLTYLPHIPWYLNPMMIVCGTLLYSVCNLIFYILMPHRPVQISMVRAYRSLSAYMMVKAQFFDPDEADFLADKEVPLAMKNTAVVTAFNECRSALFYRLRSQYRHPVTVRMLQYYLIAQNIHERISSSHVDYQTFARELQHSDLIYRIQRLIVLQAQACQQMAEALYTQQHFVTDKVLQRASRGLKQALQRYIDENTVDVETKGQLHLHSLQQLVANILSISEQLQRIENVKFSDMQDTVGSRIAGQDVESLRDGWRIIGRNLTVNSAVFRHAVRMALITGISCILVEGLNLHFGYWILLTAVLVCQPNYSATTSRLQQRVLGTVLGVIVGSSLAYLQLSFVSQLLVIVIATTFFFVFRTARYSFSTFFITIQVLVGFSLIGIDTHVAMYSRILDTIIGSGLAWFAVTYIWADWHYLTLSKTGLKAIQADSGYLQQVLQQFRQGYTEHLSYRVARREAHERASSLSNTVSDMSIEPKKYADKLPKGFQLLQLNYSLISSISALGALREQVETQIEPQNLESNQPNDLTSSNDNHNIQFLPQFFAIGDEMVALMQQMDKEQLSELEQAIADIGQAITQLQKQAERLEQLNKQTDKQQQKQVEQSSNFAQPDDINCNDTQTNNTQSNKPTSQHQSNHDLQQTQLILCTQLRRINERLLPYAKVLSTCQ